MYLNQIKQLKQEELKQNWSNTWGREVPPKIGRSMLELSLKCKMKDQMGAGLSEKQKSRLQNLISEYQKNPKYFEQSRHKLKPGVKLVRKWNGSDVVVKVLKDGYEFNDQTYGSLSKIATKITGTQRNGWRFFKI